MIKLKDLLEGKNYNSPGYENRGFGDPLPTLEDITKKYQEANGIKEESVDEGQKRDSHKAYIKYYKAYEAFARETMDLGKTISKLSGEKTTEKIIIKNFKKYVIPFAGLMNSWDTGQQENPGLSEGSCGYGLDGELGEEPAGPHLMKKKKMKEAIEMSKGVQKFKNIVDNSQAAKVGGTMVDMMSAKLFMTIYDTINDKNKEDLNKKSEKQMVMLLHKMWKKFGKNVKF